MPRAWGAGRGWWWVAALAGFLGGSGAARAGTRPYAFVQGEEGLHEGELELESWFSVGHAREGGGNTWDWWLGPVTGLTDRLETGLFAVFLQPPVPDDTNNAIELQEIRWQLTYQLAEPGKWPVDVRIRGELGAPVADVQPYMAFLNVIASKDWDRLNLTLNVGGWWEQTRTDTGHSEPYASWGLGASYALPHGVRLGAETFGAAEEGEAWMYVGPALAFGRGRVWASTSVDAGFGEESAKVVGRLVVGLFF